METLYKNIKRRRLELGFTQADLAEKMGYKDKSMISRIESGKVDLPQSKIMEFAKILLIDAGDLMGWDECTDDLSSPINYTPELLDHIKKYSRLDEIDKARIDERIDMLLEDEKYVLLKENA